MKKGENNTQALPITERAPINFPAIKLAEIRRPKVKPFLEALTISNKIRYKAKNLLTPLRLISFNKRSGKNTQLKTPNLKTTLIPQNTPKALSAIRFAVKAKILVTVKARIKKKKDISFLKTTLNKEYNPKETGKERYQRNSQEIMVKLLI